MGRLLELVDEGHGVVLGADPVAVGEVLGGEARVVLDRVGDKWTALVIGALSGGVLRFTELRTAVGGVAPKVLTETLRALERDGLVTRTVHAQVPPRVSDTRPPPPLTPPDPTAGSR